MADVEELMCEVADSLEVQRSPVAVDVHIPLEILLTVLSPISICTVGGLGELTSKIKTSLDSVWMTSCKRTMLLCLSSVRLSVCL